MARRAKELRLTQLEEFLGKVDACGAKFSQRQKKEIGKFFLEDVMGFTKGEFVSCKQGKETPDFEPRSEDLCPWALFITDKAGEEFHVVITNGKELCVFGFNHEVARACRRFV